MGSCGESTKPSHSTGLSPVNLLLLAGSDRLCRFLSQKCAVGGVNVDSSEITHMDICVWQYQINMPGVRDSEGTLWLV